MSLTVVLYYHFLCCGPHLFLKKDLKTLKSQSERINLCLEVKRGADTYSVGSGRPRLLLICPQDHRLEVAQSTKSNKTGISPLSYLKTKEIKQ